MEKRKDELPHKNLDYTIEWIDKNRSISIDSKSGKTVFSIENVFFDYKFGGNEYDLVFRKITGMQGGITEIQFMHCSFPLGFSVYRNEEIEEKISLHGQLEFKDCRLQLLNLSESTVGHKLRFRECDFYKISFQNTTFRELLDFWNCHFYQRVIFLKTDFLETTVFSASTFHENALFTYSLIEKLAIFRGTEFKKGLDLSLALISGKLQLFDLQIGDFSSYKMKDYSSKNKYEAEYDFKVTDEGIIPIMNKRETYRILKQQLIASNDISTSIKFQKLEKYALFSELWHRKFKSFSSYQKKRWKFLPSKWIDLITLSFNYISNIYGSSWGMALAFIVVIGTMFFYPAAILSDKFFMTASLNSETFIDSLGYFVQFLNPTHSLDYLGESSKYSSWFFIFDFFGRIFVGYGIYQFIQAFRKFR